ncbi:MAG: MBL fold metallo-hydrolase [Spirochaetes bacterium]|nr:MBL fold metallo-hydrolase [Spirochaetota bacterium]
MDKKTAGLSTAIHPGIFKISLPFPGRHPGPINVYLFRGERISLLDTGMLSTIGYLEKALAGLGLGFRDIDDIVISHGHIDHYGASRKIVRLSNGRAKVHAHEEDVNLIETGDDVPKSTSREFLRMMGVPFRYIAAMHAVRAAFKLMVDNCAVDIVLMDGDKIRLGDYIGQIISTPGHSKGSICVYIKDKNIIFAGDHILAHITPNALVMLEPDSILPGRLSQVEYCNSLLRIEALGSPKVYTGHGKDIDDLQRVTALYRKQFSDRREKILSIIGTGRHNVYYIARRAEKSKYKNLHYNPEIKFIDIIPR